MPRWPLLFVIAAFCAAGYYAPLHGAGALWAWGITAFCGLCVVVIAYYLAIGTAMTAVLIRAILALIPVGLLTGALIFGVLRIDVLDTQVTRALIAAVIVAAGWVVGFMTSEWRRTSAEQERRRDLIQATITELELIASFVRTADWDQVIEDTRSAFRKQARYDVFVFYGNQFMTLKRLVAQIEILKWQQISPVMQVFQLLDRLEQMEARMNEEKFNALPKSRREEGLVRYLKLSADIAETADKAVAALRNGPFQGWLKRLR